MQTFQGTLFVSPQWSYSVSVSSAEAGTGITDPEPRGTLTFIHSLQTFE